MIVEKIITHLLQKIANFEMYNMRHNFKLSPTNFIKPNFFEKNIAISKKIEANLLNFYLILICHKILVIQFVPTIFTDNFYLKKKNGFLRNYYTYFRHKIYIKPPSQKMEAIFDFIHLFYKDLICTFCEFNNERCSLIRK